MDRWMTGSTMSCLHCWPNIYTHDQKRLLYVSKWDKTESQPETTDWIGGGGGDYKGILIQTSAGFFRLPNNFSLLALHTKLKGSSWHSKFKKKIIYNFRVACQFGGCHFGLTAWRSWRHIYWPTGLFLCGVCIYSPCSPSTQASSYSPKTFSLWG